MSQGAVGLLVIVVIVSFIINFINWVFPEEIFRWSLDMAYVLCENNDELHKVELDQGTITAHCENGAEFTIPLSSSGVKDNG